MRKAHPGRVVKCKSLRTFFAALQEWTFVVMTFDIERCSLLSPLSAVVVISIPGIDRLAH